MKNPGLILKSPRANAILIKMFEEFSQRGSNSKKLGSIVFKSTMEPGKFIGLYFYRTAIN